MHPSRLAKLGPAADPSKFSIPSTTQVRTSASAVASPAAPAPVQRQNVQLTAPRNFDAPPPGATSQSWALGRGRGGPPPSRRPAAAPSRSFGQGAPRGPPAPFRGSSSSRGPPPPSFTPARPSGPVPQSVVKSAAGIHPDRLKMLGIKAPAAPQPTSSADWNPARNHPTQQQPPPNWNSAPQPTSQQSSASDWNSAPQPAPQLSASSDWRPAGLASQSQNNASQMASRSSNGQSSDWAPNMTMPSQPAPKPAPTSNPIFNATHPPPSNNRAAPVNHQGFTGQTVLVNGSSASSQYQSSQKQESYQPFGFTSFSINGKSDSKPSDSRPTSNTWDSKPAPNSVTFDSQHAAQVSSRPASQPPAQIRSQEQSAPQQSAANRFDSASKPLPTSGWDSPPPQQATPSFRPAPQITNQKDDREPAMASAPSKSASKPAQPARHSTSKENASEPTLSFETSSASVLPSDPKPQPTISFATSSGSILPKQKLGSSLKITAIFDRTDVVERRIVVQQEAPPQPSSLSALFTSSEKSANGKPDRDDSNWDNQSEYDWDSSRPASARSSAPSPSPKPAEKPVLTTQWSKVIDQHSGWSAPPPPPTVEKPAPKPQPPAPVDQWNTGPPQARAPSAEQDDGGWSSSSSPLISRESPPRNGTSGASSSNGSSNGASQPVNSARSNVLPANQSSHARVHQPTYSSQASSVASKAPISHNGNSAVASKTSASNFDSSGWGSLPTQASSTPSRTSKPGASSTSRFQQQLRQSYQLQVSSSGGWESDNEDENPSQIVAQLQSVRKTAFGVSSPV